MKCDGKLLTAVIYVEMSSFVTQRNPENLNDLSAK